VVTPPRVNQLIQSSVVTPPQVNLPIQPLVVISPRANISTLPSAHHKPMDLRAHAGPSSTSSTRGVVSPASVVHDLTISGLSARGTYDEQLIRLTESRTRGNNPYMDLTGHRYVLNGSRTQFYKYGQEVNGLIMGEGTLKIERQPYDVRHVALRDQIIPKYKIVQEIDNNPKLEIKCQGVYLTDPINLENLDQIGDSRMIYADSDRKCYYIPTILSMWEESLAMYDYQSSRIMPSYPRDVHGEYVEPTVIVSVYRTAISRGVSVKQYPLIHILVDNSDILLDI
jgi:hypothetical protein